MGRAVPAVDGQISELVARTSRLVQLGLDRRLARHGISSSQMAALTRLWEASPNPVNQTDLARDLEMERSSMSTLVAGLERAGLLSALDDPHDGRRRLLRLTAQGRRLERSVAATMQDWEGDLLAGMPAAGARDLHRLLSRVLDTARDLREAVPVNGGGQVTVNGLRRAVARSRAGR